MENEHDGKCNPSLWINVFWSEMLGVWENKFYFWNYKHLLLANCQVHEFSFDMMDYFSKDLCLSSTEDMFPV